MSDFDYYCLKCKREHHSKSRIGRKHRKWRSKNAKKAPESLSSGVYASHGNSSFDFDDFDGFFPFG